MIYGLIPAKGFSNRIPRKNLRMFCGKPLLAWTLIQMKHSLIDEVIVSTDSQEIALVCEQYGATIYWREREEESKGEVAGSVPMHFVKKWLHEYRNDIDIVIDAFATAPLRRPGDINGCINLCRRTQLTTYPLCPRYDTFIEKIVAPNRFMHHLADKAYAYGDTQAGLVVTPGFENLAALNVNKEKYKGEWWAPVSVASHTDPKVFNLEATLGGFAHKSFYEVEPWQIVEIDYDWQFCVAEYLMEKYILKGKGEEVYEKH